MPTELEELVEFLHHGNTQIRQIATEHLVGYSKEQPAIFKTDQFLPVKDLKMLVKDYTPIAKNAVIILINLSEDPEVLKCLTEDDAFLESLLLRITNAKEPNANEIAMLLANLAKSDSLKKLFTLNRNVPKGLSTSKNAMDQLMDCFVTAEKYNKNANYDYLSYLFADMAKHPEGQAYFTTPQAHDRGIIPLTKLIVFTEHPSVIRRRGVASTIKNVSFKVPSHPTLISSDSATGVNLIPYILLPLMGSEDYDDDDAEGMPDEVQLLPPDKEREKENDIMKIHLETLLLLTTTRDGRDHQRRIQVYPIIRELHMKVEDDEVRESVDRLVQVIKRDEEGEGRDEPRIKEIEEEDEDGQIIEVL